MTGSLENLRRVPGIDATPYIETLNEALKEDVDRAGRAIRYPQDDPKRRAASVDFAKQLWAELDIVFTETEPSQAFLDIFDDNILYQTDRSLASSMQTRGWRISATEQIWRLLLETGLARCRAFTLIPPNWIITPDELRAVTARQLSEQVRSQLNRRGAKDADGWLIGKLDIEFDPRNQLCRLHMHGLACGGMLDVLNRLRGGTLARPQLTPMIDGRRVARPLQIGRQPLNRLPYPISYMLKVQPVARWLGHTPEGDVRRGTRVMRIPEPHGTDILLWLNEQSLPDLFVKFGLQVRAGQLVRG